MYIDFGLCSIKPLLLQTIFDGLNFEKLNDKINT